MKVRGVLIAVALAMVSLGLTPQAAQASHVKGHSRALTSKDMYEESSSADGRRFRFELGLIVPGKGELRSQQRAADCGGCYWVVRNWGQVAVQERTTNARVMGDCPPDQWRSIQFYAAPGAAPEFRGNHCLPPGAEVTTRADLDREVRRMFQTLMPPPDASFQPARTVLINIPTIFASGQPKSVTRDFTPFGVHVRISAQAQWRWTFDKGVVEHRAAPGGKWPNDEVQYTYRVPGKRQVRVQTTWRGTYSLDGGPSRPVIGTVEQTSPWLPLTAVSSTPELIAGDD